MQVFIHQLQRCGNVIAVSNDNTGIILHYRYNNRLCIQQRVDIPAIYNGPYLQETEQHLVLPGNNNMKGS